MNRIGGMAVWACAGVVLCGSGVSGLGGDRVIDERSEAIPIDGVVTLRLDVQAGSLEVNGDSQSEQIHYKAVFRGNALSDKSAQRILEQLKLSHQRSGDTLTILTRTGGNWWWGGSGTIDLILSVPSSLELEINDRSGSIRVRDMGQGVRIADRSGSITLEGVGGDVEIDDGSGSITVTQVGGDLKIDDGSGRIGVRDVGGSADIKDHSGSITLERVRADLVIDDRSGSIQVRDVGGSADIRDSSGGIRVVDVAQNLLISDSSGGISVLSVGGDFEVTRDGSGSIKYDGVSGQVRIP